MEMNSSVSGAEQLKNRISDSDNSKVSNWTLMNNSGKSIFAQICRYKTHIKMNIKIPSVLKYILEQP